MPTKQKNKKPSNKTAQTGRKPWLVQNFPVDLRLKFKSLVHFKGIDTVSRGLEDLIRKYVREEAPKELWKELHDKPSA